MAAEENTHALISLERLKQHANISTDTHDVELVQIINETSSRAERFMGRHIYSRTYTHDGTTLPRLDSLGGTDLLLPETPVTSITSLKLTPDATALTEGWDGDFTVDAMSGIVTLMGGSAFSGSQDRPARGYVEITYVAGYHGSPTEEEGWYWGASVAGSEIRAAITQQAAWSFHQKDRLREGISSVTTEGATVSYLTGEWLPEVEEILTAHRRAVRL